MTFLTKLWRAMFVIGITAVLLSLSIWFVNLFLKKSQKMDDSWVESYCQISKIMAKNGPHVYVSYWVKDSVGNPTIIRDRYAASLRLSTPVIDEIFPIAYNPNNPDEFFAFSWNPVFLNKEITKSTTGIISRAPYQSKFFSKKPEKYSAHSIEFTFWIDGSCYRKSQHLPPMFIRNSPGKIKKGDKFEVEYWIENPQRAIIYLDKPIP